MRPYKGPTGLSGSKYAYPSAASGQPTAAPTGALSTSSAGSPSAVSANPAVPAGNNPIATANQVVASTNEAAVSQQRDDTLAQQSAARRRAFDQDVGHHIAILAEKLTDSKAEACRLLALIRQSHRVCDELEHDTASKLGVELQKLYEIAAETKSLLPKYLEQQRSTLAFQYSVLLNNVVNDTHHELRTQHKKIDIQHDLILEQHQAFVEHKAQTDVQLAAQLAERQEIKAKNSRLTLENGNFRNELDKIVALEKALKNLEEVKLEAVEEAVAELQEKREAAEKQLTERFTAELKDKDDLLAKESMKNASLNTLVSSLQSNECAMKNELAKLQVDNQNLTEKYSHMASEHAKLFSKDKEQFMKVETLTADAERLHEENAELAEKLTKLSELEKQNIELPNKHTVQSEKLSELTAEIDAVNVFKTRAEQALGDLKETVKNLQKENEALMAKEDDLISMQTPSGEPVRMCAEEMVFALTMNNQSLQKKLNKMKLEASATVTNPKKGEEVEALEAKVKELEENKAALAKSLDEWSELARSSYSHYRALESKAAQDRKDVVEKEEQLQALKLELATKASQPNGAAPSTDAVYWKDRYENLISSLSD